MHRRRHPKDPAIARSVLIATWVSIVFLLIGVAWVVVTDVLADRYVEDEQTLRRLQAAKGWLFVAFAVAVIFVTINFAVRRLARSNATLEAVVTSISDGVFLLDRGGAIAHANPAAARILGADDPQELIGLDGADFARRYQVALPNGRLIPPERLVSQRALTGEHPPPYKAVLHPPGKPDVVTVVTAAPVRPVPEGPVALAVSVLHDVTTAERIDKMRDAFVSSAAHTLKTPVAVINAQIDLLATGKTPSVKASTDAIKRQSGRIARLTDNLLVLARIKSDSLELQPEAVDLASVVNEAASDMAAASPDHQLRTEVREHPMVFADRDRLALIVRNLIEVAYRRSMPRTDVALVLGGDTMHGRVSVSYQPVASYEVFAEWDADAGFAGLGLERYVSSELVSASKGTLGSDAIAKDRHEDWVQIPTMEEVQHV